MRTVIERPVPDGKGGYVTRKFEIILDEAMLLDHLGPKAAKNKSGRTKSAYGAIIVQVL